MSGDAVNHPPHYTAGKVEVIEILEQAVQHAPEPVLAGLQWQTLKYLLRLWLKDSPEQDARKAQWYLNRLVNALHTPSVVITPPEFPAWLYRVGEVWHPQALVNRMLLDAQRAGRHVDVVPYSRSASPAPPGSCCYEADSHAVLLAPDGSGCYRRLR